MRTIKSFQAQLHTLAFTWLAVNELIYKRSQNDKNVIILSASRTRRHSQKNFGVNLTLPSDFMVGYWRVDQRMLRKYFATIQHEKSCNDSRFYSVFEYLRVRFSIHLLMFLSNVSNKIHDYKPELWFKSRKRRTFFYEFEKSKCWSFAFTSINNRMVKK